MGCHHPVPSFSPFQQRAIYYFPPQIREDTNKDKDKDLHKDNDPSLMNEVRLTYFSARQKGLPLTVTLALPLIVIQWIDIKKYSQSCIYCDTIDIIVGPIGYRPTFCFFLLLLLLLLLQSLSSSSSFTHFYLLQTSQPIHFLKAYENSYSNTNREHKYKDKDECKDNDKDKDAERTTE